MAAAVRGTVVSISLDTDNPVDLMNTFMGQSASGWSYLDAEAQRLTEGAGLLIRSEVVHTRGREPAKALRNKIRSLVDSVEGASRLKLDFAGVDGASSSFLDELLARLVQELSPAVFKAKIEVVNMDPRLHALARAVTAQRMSLPERSTS